MVSKLPIIWKRTVVQLGLRVRLHIIRNERIENVGKYQSCMVSKLPIIWKRTRTTSILLTGWLLAQVLRIPTPASERQWLVGTSAQQLPEPVSTTLSSAH